MRIKNVFFDLSSLLVLSAITLVGTAQQPTRHKVINLVMPKGAGRIVIPAGDDIQWQTVNLYDEGNRPVFQLTNKSTKVEVSYQLFPNSTGSLSPRICRDDVLDTAMRSLSPNSGLADIKQIKKSDHDPINGQPIAVGSFFVASVAQAKIAQQNLFGVAASSTTCADIHISKSTYQPTDESAMSAQLAGFHFDPDYSPTMMDYFTLGSIFYSVTQSYESAVVYFQRALNVLPSDTPLNFKRVLIDQLAMSYGMSGQIKQSRAVNEAAIKSDPDYPLYYYNLACADAEQHKPDDAKIHLQQAFDRKSNVIPGEKLPDPTKDDSLLKLKKNKEFWTFVEGLSKAN